MPAAEVEISVELVRALLRSQCPDLAGSSITPLASGWDNAMFRLGEHHTVRLPRRAAAVPLVVSEQRWLPDLAADLPIAIPVPERCGVPGEGYPWPWSVLPYLPGRSVLSLLDEGGALADPVADAGLLGRFHVAFHRPAPPDAPANPVRGVPLPQVEERLLARLTQIGDDLPGGLDAATIRRRWDRAVGAPPWQGPPRWIQGDPHPGNLLTDGTRITAVVDFGDITGGDPATDLAAAWLVFDADARAAYREVVRPDADTWLRAQGWALVMGVAMLATSADNPPYERLGARAVAAVLTDPA